jgi:imidazolonepropionase-like amidohydrolase
VRARTLAALLLLAGATARIAVAGPPAADNLAIVHARLWTLETAKPIEDATVVVAGAAIRSIAAGAPPPPGLRVVDAGGHIVTTGFMTAGTQLGLVEVGSIPDTRDFALASGPLGAAFDVQYGLNANSTMLPLALADGLTRAIAFPDGSPVAPFLGQAALLHLGTGALLERARVAMFVRVGNRGAAAAGGSRSASWILLRNALDEVRHYRPSAGPRDQLLSRLDAEALQPVVAGRMPLAIVADRESDIRQAVQLKAETGVRIIIFGGTEAWRVAAELARAEVPVVIDPANNLPPSLDSIGARLDNAALLVAAGVQIAFTASGFNRTYNAGSGVRLGAGVAVANGLSYVDGLRALTTWPGRIFGLGPGAGALKSGSEADLVEWDGDPLEPSSSPLRVWVRGRELALDVSRQHALARRYAPRAVSDRPAAYR